MAPKKKKKAANPARGFATTSVASKNKTQSTEDTPQDASIPDTPKHQPESSHAEKSTAVEAQHTHTDQKDLLELSPEELERRLEDADLQNFLDRNSAKTHKESSRHANKLQTDCRLLRGHAQNLQSSYLLPQNSVARLVRLAAEDIEKGRSDAATGTLQTLPKGDDLVARLWKLQQMLDALGFPPQHIEGAFKHVLRFPPSDDEDSQIWALEKCIDWLGVNMPEIELPVFDTNTGKVLKLKAEGGHAEIEDNNMSNDSEAPEISESRTSGMQKSNRPHHTTNLPTPPEDVEVSDVDSDVDPEEMQSVYLRSREKLFGIRPDLIADSTNNKAKKTPKVPGIPSKTDLPPGVLKLVRRLERIEADVLFDKAEAEDRWIQRRNLLAKELSQNRKLHLSRPETPMSTKESSGGTEESGNQSAQHESDDPKESSKEESDDDDQALADLFSALPADDDTAKTQTLGQQQDTADSTIFIRQFAISKGVEPRRILEDVCKARDSGVKINHQRLSSSAFSIRHSLTVTWSKGQTFGEALQDPAVETTMNSRRCMFTMKKLAAPDTAQSLGYIAVFALFQISAATSGDEKAYLRLAAPWRQLWNELQEAYKIQLESSQKETIRNLRSLVDKHVQDDGDEDVIFSKNLKKRYGERAREEKAEPDLSASAEGPATDFSSIWQHKSSTPAFRRMQRSRQQLPMWQFKDYAVKAVQENQVTILCGETGCGKSTQMPAFLLESEMSNGRPCKIYCTEPRRISAITLAQRVGQELGEQKRDIGTNRSLVGYAIRLESQIASSTRLVYATTGIVLRMLENADGLSDVTHVIIDEVHERSIETDFLLIILRKLLASRPQLKLILMSATVDASRFSVYFGRAPVLSVPGRTFPVQRRFLEDAIELTGHVVEQDEQYRGSEDEDDDDDGGKGPAGANPEKQYLASYSSKTRNTLAKWNQYRIDYHLILKLISTVVSHPQYFQFSQAILVFLPGLAEIRRMNDLLSGTPVASSYRIHMLHSSVSSEEQQEAFVLPPKSMGKIVLSTNIAETGVTIPDVTCVIDTGTHKEMRFDERRQISRLKESFISRANAKQRCGRAGRVQEGLCFHLFTKYRHDQRMVDQQTPEMLRLSLQDLVMRVKICKLGDIQNTLAQALDPPSSKNIRRAIDTLIEVDALTNREELTDLGLQLSKLPLDPYLGKLVLYGALFSCLDVCVTLAAILTTKSPFSASPSDRKHVDLARSSFSKHNSDLLTEYAAYTAWRRVCLSNSTSEHQYCRKNCLSLQTLSNIEDIKAQLLSALIDDVRFISLSPADRATLSRVSNAGSRTRRFVPIPPTSNSHANNTELMSALIAWSFYPKLLTRDGKGWRNVATNQSVSLHPTSVIRLAPSAAMNKTQFLSFYSITQSGGGKYNASSVTPVSPLLLALLAGQCTFHPTAHAIAIDGARARFLVDVAPPRKKDRTAAAMDNGVRDGEGDVMGPWKTYIALKMLRRRLEEITKRKWRQPGAELPSWLERWWAAWEGIVARWEKEGG